MRYNKPKYGMQGVKQRLRNPEIWLFIFVLGLLGLNWPFLEIFHVSVVKYLIVFWFLFIVLVAFAVYTMNRQRRSEENQKKISS